MTKKKKHVKRIANYPSYPNQATQEYRMQKLIDCIIEFASGVGLTVSILFLLSLT